MPRPRFTPTPRQQRLMDRLGKQHDRIKAEDARLTDLIAQAKGQGIPIEHIADATGVTVKTIYNRLARLEQS